MTNYARIINNVAVDVSTDPENNFHPSLSVEFAPVPDAVVPGSFMDEEGAWIAPSATAFSEPATAAPKVSPVEFKLLFSSQERVSIKSARATDPVIDDFYDIVEDPRLSFVDLGLKSTQDAISYMVAKGLITETRRQEILAGQVQ